MARPFKIRCIQHLPGATVFKPAGAEIAGLKTVTIHFDELEALRLVNIEGLDQIDAARRMGISRPTIGRMLKGARRKITQALVNGEGLVIQRGNAPLQHVVAGVREIVGDSPA